MAQPPPRRALSAEDMAPSIADRVPRCIRLHGTEVTFLQNRSLIYGQRIRSRSLHSDYMQETPNSRGGSRPFLENYRRLLACNCSLKTTRCVSVQDGQADTNLCTSLTWCPGRESNPKSPKPKTRETARRCAVSVAEQKRAVCIWCPLIPSSSPCSTSHGTTCGTPDGTGRGGIFSRAGEVETTLP